MKILKLIETMNRQNSLVPKSYLLEVNLVSAQELTRAKRNMKTYVVAWVDPSEKLRSRTDISGHDNPTWNDKFMFNVDIETLNSVTSCLVMEIYCLRRLRKDKLIGTTRVLLNNLKSCSNRYHEGLMKGTFRAFHVHCPSSEPQGILNIGINILDGFSFQLVNEFVMKKRFAVDYGMIMADSDYSGDDEHDHDRHDRDDVKNKNGDLESIERTKETKRTSLRGCFLCGRC